jgi:hypothetical protein
MHFGILQQPPIPFSEAQYKQVICCIFLIDSECEAEVGLKAKGENKD